MPWKRFTVLRKSSILGYIANNWGYLKIFSEKEKLENFLALRILCGKGIAAGRDDRPRFGLHPQSVCERALLSRHPARASPPCELWPLYPSGACAPTHLWATLHTGPSAWKGGLTRRAFPTFCGNQIIRFAHIILFFLLASSGVEGQVHTRSPSGWEKSFP